MKRKIFMETIRKKNAHLKLPFKEADLIEGLTYETSHAELVSEPLDKKLGDNYLFSAQSN